MQRRSFELPRDVSAPSRARRLCERACAEWDLEVLIPQCDLLVSELVTNAVLHGDGPISVEFVHSDDDRLRVTVVDAHDGTAPELLEGDPEPAPVNLSESGRGLAIVAAVASRWGSRPGLDSTQVWFELGSQRST